MQTRQELPALEVVFFECRDLGYGIETGEVTLPALGPADWVGKRPYRSEPTGEIVYLFDDEVLT